MWQVVFAGLSLGLVSSFHCVGMCGPLVLSLPINRNRKASKFWSISMYHGGRIGTYALFGLIFGMAGRKIYLAGFQQWFSILLGIMILLSLVANPVGSGGIFASFLKGYSSRVRRSIATLWASNSKFKFMLLGGANGLLPCGMVYLAVAGALSFSDLGRSIAFMSMFGAGTLPTLLALSLLTNLVSVSFRNGIRKIVPYLVAAMGCLLIIRGLNLGIPYLSPLMTKLPVHSISCR